MAVPFLVREARELGWAASGRNGGFCEASLTHGEKNGLRRWPEEYDTLYRMGIENLDEMAATLEKYGIDCDFERTGEIVVAVEPHQVAELEGEGFLNQQQMRAEVNSPTFLAGHWDGSDTAMLNPAKLVFGLARVATALGVQIFEHSAVTELKRGKGGSLLLLTAHGKVAAQRAILATNVFPSVLKRYRLHTLPVYDYALMTAPLSEAQLKAIGWQNRQGLADPANQFHYYRITRDNRILFGGYDALYYFGGKVKEEYDARPASFERLASHFFTTSPSWKGLNSPINGAAPSIPPPASAPSSAMPAAGEWPMLPVSPALALVPAALPPMCCWTRFMAWIPSAPDCAWCGKSPCPSRPSPSPTP